VINRYYQSLAPRTRAIIGCSMIGYGIAGLFLTRALESAVPSLAPTDEDRQKLAELVPRVRSVNREFGGAYNGGDGDMDANEKKGSQ
jgi:hypothetical protein